jgi:hypothetical protein
MDPSTSTDAAAAAATGLWALMSTMCCFAYLIPIGVGVAGMVLWIITIIDVAQRNVNEFPSAQKGVESPNEQIVWVLVVVLTGFIGALIYWVVVMRPYPRIKHSTLTVEPPVTRPATPAPPTDPAASPAPAAPVQPAPAAPATAAPAGPERLAPEPPAE